MFRIAVITDIHNGPDLGTKKGSAAPALMRQFVDFVAERQPDLMIDLGDRVNHISTAIDSQSMQQVADFFSKISSQRIHIMGNHDVDYLSIPDNERITGQDFGSSVIQAGGFTFICWNARVYLDRKTGFELPDSDIEWLADAVAGASYPTIICSHIPLDNGSMIGNFYFEKQYPQHAHYPAEKAEQVRKILEQSGKVILCLNGHTHWNAYHCIDGIHYVTLPSLTETFVTYPDPHGAWTWIEIDQQKIDIEIFGKTPMRYVLPVRKENHHWVNVDKDYSPLAKKPA